MQTLRLIHRLNLRLIGVSGGAIALQSSEIRAQSGYTFVDNFWSELVGQTISSSAYSSVTITNKKIPKMMFDYPNNRSSL